PHDATVCELRVHPSAFRTEEVVSVPNARRLNANVARRESLLTFNAVVNSRFQCNTELISSKFASEASQQSLVLISLREGEASLTFRWAECRATFLQWEKNRFPHHGQANC